MIIAKFISHNFIYSIGVELALVPFLNLTIPTATVHGSLDSIAPKNQGTLLQQMSGAVSIVVEGANHRIYALNEGKDFFDVIEKVLTVPQKPNTNSKIISRCLDKHNDWQSYPCVPSYVLSNVVSKYLENRLLNTYRKCLNESLTLINEL